MKTIDQLLEQAAIPVELDRAAMTAALDGLGSALPALASTLPEETLTATGRDTAMMLKRRRRRRRRRILTGAAGLAILGVAAPAAAGYVQLHTGIFGVENGHRGEYLRLDSPDVMGIAQHFETQYPLPPGGSWAAVESRLRSTHAGVAQVGQAGVLEEAVGFESQCQWEQAWLRADETGDSSGASRDAAVLSQVASWHVITAYADSTGGVITLARQVADAARRGDRTPVQQAVNANCSSTAPSR